MSKRKRACSNPNPNGGDCGFPFLMGTLFALLMLWALWSIKDQLNKLLLIPTAILTTSSEAVLDPPDKTFYDDPDLSYSIEKPLNNWDEKRSEWLRLHPRSAAAARRSILLVTGSQPSPCKNSVGDHLLLRCFKNKVDYCRIHGCEVYYNNLHLHPKMDSYWAKLPVLRSTMMAHPEVEWIWWMDADAVLTDMEFTLPMERYKDHNLVVHGWPNMVYEEKNKSWTGLNAGSVLIRNCQWSVDLLHVWSKMGPVSPNYEKWGKVLKSVFKDKMFPLPDDQSSLIYLLFKEREKWGRKTYLEGGYELESYWLSKLGSFEGINDGGDHNPRYDGDTCWKEMERALNFADNQVLRNYGFVRKDLTSSYVYEVPFDFPRRDVLR
ncbi:Glycosyltransferase 6 [Spatholobus suberectus]|nr:Glycosyltransferase 6 [Spatholobus suberectus]